MELKPGYKMTEVGVIPEDWEVNRIKNIAEIKTGGKNTQDSITGGRYPFFVRSQTVERINTYSFDGEAVLTAGDGVGTGKIFHYINGKFDYHQRVYKISNFSNQLNGYFFYLYFSNYFYDRIMQMTAKSSVDSVRMEMIADMPIALPPISEQQAIAAALSDVDELLDSLDRLIAKKKDIRLAAMQELLTGKTRLPGFDEPWSKKLFGELFEFLPTNAYTRAQFTDEGTIKNIHYGDILTMYENYIDVKKSKLPFINELLSNKSYTKKSFVMDGDIIIANTAEDFLVGKTVEIVNINGKILSGQHTFLCRPKIKFIRKFLGYIVNAYYFQNQINTYITGIKVSSISKFSISKLKLKFPLNLHEQQAIVFILSDMDAEIEALEARRDKVRHIKAGMMQELLSGKTRLISSGERA